MRDILTVNRLVQSVQNKTKLVLYKSFKATTLLVAAIVSLSARNAADEKRKIKKVLILKFETLWKV